MFLLCIRVTVHYVYGAAVAMLFPDTLCRLVSISVASSPGHSEGEEKTAWYIYTHSAYVSKCIYHESWYIMNWSVNCSLYNYVMHNRYNILPKNSVNV